MRISHAYFHVLGIFLLTSAVYSFLLTNVEPAKPTGLSVLRLQTALGIVLSFVGFGGEIGIGARVFWHLASKHDLNNPKVRGDIVNLVAFSVYALIGIILVFRSAVEYLNQ